MFQEILWINHSGLSFSIRKNKSDTASTGSCDTLLFRDYVLYILSCASYKIMYMARWRTAIKALFHKTFDLYPSVKFNFFTFDLYTIL